MMAFHVIFYIMFSCNVHNSFAIDWGKILAKGSKITAEERQQLSANVSIASETAAANSRSQVRNLLAREAQVLDCPVCVDKDFSEPCPLGWHHLGEGRCSAPTKYTGICNRTQYFIGSTVEEKMEAEFSCSVCWPCKVAADAESICNRQWHLPCPSGYSPKDIPYNEFGATEGMTCVQDLLHDGPCEYEVSFADDDAKFAFAARCRTSWPCESGCEDIPTNCPIDWIHIGRGSCVAPNSYKTAVPGCALLQDFRGWKPKMKREFSVKCQVQWSCDASSRPNPLCSHTWRRSGKPWLPWAEPRIGPGFHTPCRWRDPGFEMQQYAAGPERGR